MHIPEGHILVVDDDVSVRRYLTSLFRKEGLPFIACESAADAMTQLQENAVSLVLTDIMMPEVSGIELLDQVRAFNAEIPVILMTGFADLEVAIEAINKGAFSFLTKPFRQSNLLSVVMRGLEHFRLVEAEKTYTTKLENTVLRKTRELEDTLTMANQLSLELVQRLSAVAEFRDSYTAAHIRRIGLYSKVVAEAMHMYKDFVEAVTVASSLHDIGKIGIPDNILLKTAPLTTEERAIMKEHTTMGSKILGDSSHPTIQMACSIALHHHERWDGGGYPLGLKRSEIPIEARIVKLADEYDAIRSKRSYKPPLDHREALRIIREGDDRTSPEHLDPDVLGVFEGVAPRFEEIFASNSD